MTTDRAALDVRALMESVHQRMVEAIAYAYDSCDQTHFNLPETIRAALEDFAAQRDFNAFDLVVHRPGSWEATHILALGAGADYRDLDQDLAGRPRPREGPGPSVPT